MIRHTVRCSTGDFSTWLWYLYSVSRANTSPPPSPSIFSFFYFFSSSFLCPNVVLSSSFPRVSSFLSVTYLNIRILRPLCYQKIVATTQDGHVFWKFNDFFYDQLWNALGPDIVSTICWFYRLTRRSLSLVVRLLTMFDGCILRDSTYNSVNSVVDKFCQLDPRLWIINSSSVEEISLEERFEIVESTYINHTVFSW